MEEKKERRSNVSEGKEGGRKVKKMMLKELSEEKRDEGRLDKQTGG